MNAGERLDALTAEGGIQVCGNAQNCVKVCPKGIPLTTAIARGGRAATLHALKHSSTGRTRSHAARMALTFPAGQDTLPHPAFRNTLLRHEN